MKRRSTYLLIILLTAFVSFSQTRVYRPVSKKPIVISKPKYPKRTNLGLGIGVTRSVLYLARNVKANNDATGLNASVVYGGSKVLRASLEYTYYRPIDISPTWYKINAHTVELNVHIMARFPNRRAFFYPLFGISFNSFSGFFTGVNDYLNLTAIYPVDQRVKTRWVGINAGTGYEYYFKPGSFFLDYKMRVGKTEGYNQLNIQDVCITAGLRFNIRVPSFYSIYMYRGVRSRYLLDTEDDD